MTKAKQPFWEEICGTVAFKRLGLSSFDGPSLEVFDEWYFNHYPYLEEYITDELSLNNKILEVGLGFGSVGHRLSKNALKYIGVDLAKNPVDLMNERIKISNISNAKAIQASVLNLPLEDNYFDVVVSIGCIHHTTSIDNALKELFRVLKPGGQLILMVYAKYSLATLFTPMYFVVDVIKNGFSYNKLYHFKRYMFDNNSSGDEAPETNFSSKNDLLNYLNNFEKVTINRENYWFPFFRKKNFFMKTRIVKAFGNDWYIRAIK